MSDVVVLIATIPERRKSLEDLLRGLEIQTHDDFQILLVGDGYPDLASLIPETLMVPLNMAHAFPERLGAGNRWRVVAEHTRWDPDTIIINIDDDLLVAPNAIEVTLWELESLKGQALAWCGFVGTLGEPSWQWHLLEWEPRLTRRRGQQHAQKLSAPCSMACAFRAGLLRGISNQPDADTLLGVLGDDELLLAAHLHQQDVSFYRPSVRCPFMPGRAQFDDYAQHKKPRSSEVNAARYRTYCIVHPNTPPGRM